MRNLSKTALLMIDVQKGFDLPVWGSRNNPEADQNIELLLSKFRGARVTIIHTQHNSKNLKSPLHPTHPGNEFKDHAKPLEGEPVIQKTVNSAFIGTELELELRKRGIETLVIAGLITNHCVSTTARMAGNLGYETFVVSDATHSFDMKSVNGEMIPAQVMHDVGLAELNDEFATILTSKQILEYL